MGSAGRLVGPAAARRTGDLGTDLAVAGLSLVALFAGGALPLPLVT